MDWCEFWRHEPFGKEWHGISLLGALIASNGWFNGKVPLDSFLPSKPPQTAEEISAGIAGFFQGLQQLAEANESKTVKRG